MSEHTPFETVIKAMIDIGLYDFFFPFLITSVIMYALLRKARILGDSAIINGVIAMTIGLLVFAFPVVVGLTFTTELSTFFVQSTAWILILVVGAIIASVFYPDLTSILSSQMKSRSFMFIMLAIAISIFIVSGMVGVFVNTGNPVLTGQEPETPGPPSDIVIIIAALIIFMVLITIAGIIVTSRKG